MSFERFFERADAFGAFNRRILLLVLAVVATVAVGAGLFWSGLPAAQAQGGAPTPISDADELRAVADDLDGDYILMNNISLLNAAGETVSWTPIGSRSGGVFTGTGGFTGTFDGGGYEISGLWATTASANCEVGLFGHLGVGGTVRNVGLRDVYVSDVGTVNGAGDACETITRTPSNFGDGAFVGALVGSSFGVVEASYVVGGTVRGLGNTGGLVGAIGTSGTIMGIIGSFADVAVEGLGASADVGGLLGQSLFSRVESSYALGDVSGSGATLGGLVGSNHNGFVSSAIRRSFATGNVASGSDNGGLVGSVMRGGSVLRGTRVESYQTSDSAGMNYLSLADLQAADASTTGFASWDEDLCPAGTRNAGAPVWNFGAADELPTISCISVTIGFTRISDATELAAIANDLDGNYVLTSDIDLQGVSWTPLGGDTPNAFSGVFDGAGYEISNLQVLGADGLDCRVGLFGFVDGGTVRNVGLRAVNVDSAGGMNSAGTACGLPQFTTAASLVATLRNGRVEASYVVGGTVDGSIYVGGLVGRVLAPTGGSSTTVANSFANVTVNGSAGSATQTERGGLVARSQGDIISSAAVGDVSGTGRKGGLVGNNVASAGTITNSFATGNVASGGGGLVGTGSGTVVASYQTSESGGDNYLSPSALVAADATTAGFETWDDDLCSVEAAMGGGEPVWNFGRDFERPFLNCIPAAAQGAFTEISDAAGLRAIADDLSANYILINDIDLETASWSPLGFLNVPFTGTFDGAGFEISNLRVEDTPANCRFGLFGFIDNGGTVRNVGLRDVYASSENSSSCEQDGNLAVGGLVGLLNTGTVEASYVVGGTVRSHQSGGGLVGHLYSDVVGSFADVEVVGLGGSGVIGGLVGSLLAPSAEVRSSYAVGDVSGSGRAFGSLVGENVGVIRSSFATGSVSGGSGGGLIGSNVGGTITDSYQITNSAAANYLSWSALGAATAATAGFGTWDDDMCGDGAVAGAGGMVWNFDAANELPIINCIDSPQRRIIVPAVVDGVVQIGTAEHLRSIAYDLGETYALTNDIDLTGGETWTPIGDNSSSSSSFSGVFDGGGYEIIGLRTNEPTTTCEIGLFGYIDGGGTVRNLGLRDVYVSSEGSGCESDNNLTLGALAGFVDNGGRIEASYVVGGTVRSHNHAGGLVGQMGNGVVEGSFADVEIVGLSGGGGNNSLGGLVGISFFNSAEVRSSYALGSVSGSGTDVGGLVGRNVGLIRSSFARGSVPSGGDGLVSSSSGTVTESYQTSDSTETATYRSLAALGSATAATAGFETWDDDMCGSEAVTGAGGMVWNFGAVGELPRVSCIGLAAQPVIITPTVVNGVVQLSTAEHLRTIADDLGASYALTTDITLTLGAGETSNWTPLGTSSDGFSGVLDGGGYEIRGLRTGRATGFCEMGLVGWLDGGTVRNLGLRDVYFSSEDSGCEQSGTLAVGALAGYVDNGGRIEASYVVGGTVRSHLSGGGLVGQMENGVVAGSFADVEVVGLSGSGVLGGLVGSLSGGSAEVRSSYAVGDVSGSGRAFGSLVGENGGGTIISSFARGSVSGGGSLLGSNVGGTMTESYQTSDSGWTDYMSLAALGSATPAATPGFGTWDGDMCASEAVVGANGAVWNFGAAGELPRVSCIRLAVQPVISAPTVVNNVVQLSTADHLGTIAADLSASYALTSDIDLESANWTPIGSLSAAFTGTFDGRGFEISNLLVTGADVDSDCLAGFFGNIAGGGVVRNLGLRNVDVSNEIGRCDGSFNSRSGALAGSVVGSGRVESSYVVGGTVAGFSDVGGLVGRLSGTGSAVSVALVNSFADVDVVGWENSLARGGLVGEISNSSEIRSSYALGDVSGQGNYVGGLVGYHTGSLTTVVNSFAMGEVVSGAANFGGLIGRIDINPGPITNNYQTSDSGGDYYLSLADLASATAGTMGFGTWDDDMCASEAVAGASGVVWNFGAAGDVPRINCIRLREQQLISVPPVVNGVVQISTAAHLRAVADDLGADYVLTNNINLAGANWTPIGSALSAGFTGTFDGDGYEIRNLQVRGADLGTICFAGLFGAVVGGVVRNVGLRNVDVSNGIDRCRSAGGGVGVGALVGTLFSGGRVEASYVVGGTVTGTTAVGGLVGRVSVQSAAVVNSFADVAVVGLFTGLGRGGLVGDVGSSATIRSSYALGAVGGTGNQFGGLVGFSGAATVVNSFATGAVSGTASGTTESNGLIGSTSSGSVITNSYQTSDSDDDYYLSLRDLAEATAGTAGFETWDDDNCGSEAARGAGGMVWNFGTVDELPRINCISAAVQRRSAIVDPNNPGAPTGPGVTTDFTEISTVAELRAIADDLDGNYILTDDIDLMEVDSNGARVSWTPLGSANSPFTGVFDGGNYDISGLWTTTATSACEIGLFGHIDGGTIRRVYLRDVYVSSEGSGCESVSSNSSVGSLAGSATGGARVELSAVLGGTVRGHHNVGGLIGDLDDGVVTTVVMRVLVVGLSANANVGGVLGRLGPNGGGWLICVYGDVGGVGFRGGLVGENSGTITSSIATGSVSGGGGLVGRGMGTVTESYQTSDSEGANYLTFDELEDADATTPGFASWDDVVCPPGTLNEGEPIWNFGGAGALPTFNCIVSEVGQNVFVSDDFETVDAGMLPAFTRVDLSDIRGTVGGGSFTARLDYEAGGGTLYPTTVGWRIASGSNVFTLMTLDDEPFLVDLIFRAVGTGEIEVLVLQAGAPTEEWRVTGNVTISAAATGSVPAAFVPPPDPPGVAPVGSVRPSVGGAVVMELDSGDAVTIEIPAGASNDFLRVEVANVPSSALNGLPQLPFGVEILAFVPAVDIDLMDSNNAEVRRVNRPTRVCLPLSAAEYGQIENPASLRVVTYHDGAANWDVLNAEYDFVTEQLCAYTSRFSVFAIGLASPQLVSDGLFLPSTGDGGVLGLWGVAGLGLFGAVLILAGVLVVVRRKFPNFRSARS